MPLVLRSTMLTPSISSVRPACRNHEGVHQLHMERSSLVRSDLEMPRPRHLIASSRGRTKHVPLFTLHLLLASATAVPSRLRQLDSSVLMRAPASIRRPKPQVNPFSPGQRHGVWTCTSAAAGRNINGRPRESGFGPQRHGLYNK